MRREVTGQPQVERTRPRMKNHGLCRSSVLRRRWRHLFNFLYYYFIFLKRGIFRHVTSMQCGERWTRSSSAYILFRFHFVFLRIRVLQHRGVRSLVFSRHFTLYIFLSYCTTCNNAIIKIYGMAKRYRNLVP